MLKNKSKLKFFTVIAVMLVSIIALTGCGTNNKTEDNNKKNENEEASFETPIKNYYEGLQTANLDTLMKSLPSFIYDEAKEKMTEEVLNVMLEQAKEEYGENLKISYVIKNKKEIAEEDLKSEQNDIKTMFNSDITITKGYIVDVETKVKGDNKEDTNTNTLEVYEIDGNWYLLSL